MEINSTGATPPDLFVIEHCADTFVDVCLRDEAGKLLMLSVYGRDTAIRELQAKIQLGGKHKDGLTELVLKPAEDVGIRLPQRVSVGDPSVLEKVTGRLPRCLYGNLTHMWLYNPVIKAPQKGADFAWIVVRTPKPGFPVNRGTPEAQVVLDRLWAAIKHLANIPLLEHWQTPVLKAVVQSKMVLIMGKDGNDRVHPVMSAPVGAFYVCKLEVDQDKLGKIITELICKEVLTIEQGINGSSAPQGVQQAQLQDHSQAA